MGIQYRNNLRSVLPVNCPVVLVKSVLPSLTSVLPMKRFDRAEGVAGDDHDLAVRRACVWVPMHAVYMHGCGKARVCRGGGVRRSSSSYSSSCSAMAMGDQLGTEVQHHV